MLKDKAVAFNSRSVPRNATDKMSLARFPTSSATLRLKESREGAPRTLGRQKVPRNQRLRKYLLICGPSKFAAQARSSIGAQGQNQGLAWSLDSSLWGNQVQKRKKITSFGQNQGLAWSSDSGLWGNQLLVRKNYITWTLGFI